MGKRNDGNEFYHTPEWKRIRLVVLQRDGYKCCMCGVSVRGAFKAVVDHIIPRRERPDLALDIWNLQTLCRDKCHNSVKKKDEANPLRGVNDNGFPNDGSWD